MWKHLALQTARKDIYQIMDDGYEVKMLTDYHWKINGVDVWPSALKYMKNGVVKRYENLFDLVSRL